MSEHDLANASRQTVVVFGRLRRAERSFFGDMRAMMVDIVVAECL